MDDDWLTFENSTKIILWPEQQRQQGSTAAPPALSGSTGTGTTGGTSAVNLQQASAMTVNQPPTAMALEGGASVSRQPTQMLAITQSRAPLKTIVEQPTPTVLESNVKPNGAVDPASAGEPQSKPSNQSKPSGNTVYEYLMYLGYIKNTFSRKHLLLSRKHLSKTPPSVRIQYDAICEFYLT